jgi:hypothetical protein
MLLSFASICFFCVFICDTSDEPPSNESPCSYKRYVHWLLQSVWDSLGGVKSNKVRILKCCWYRHRWPTSRTAYSNYMCDHCLSQTFRAAYETQAKSYGLMESMPTQT